MQTYTPKDVNIIVGTTIVDDWETVSVVKDEDDNTFDTGADGEVSVTENANDLGTFTITCPQTSKTNLVLSAFGKSAVLPIVIRDKSGSSLHAATKAKRIKPPDAEYGKEKGTRAWSYRGKLDINIIGGN